MQKAYWRLSSLEDTAYLARCLAQALPNPAIIALTGDLGAGKTTFSQHLARALGVSEFLPSPTFTLMNEYQLDSQTVIHADLYRLHSLEEVYELGITDYFTQPNTITLVEWADRARSVFPAPTIWLDFVLMNDVRVVEISSRNHRFWHHFQPKGHP